MAPMVKKHLAEGQVKREIGDLESNSADSAKKKGGEPPKKKGRKRLKMGGGGSLGGERAPIRGGDQRDHYQAVKDFENRQE